VNVALMWLGPGLETVPFHLIWISLAIVYGLHAWPVRLAVTACVVVAVLTAIPLTSSATAGVIPFEEITEIPLMSALFLVMVWHVRRRITAVEDARRSAEREQVATRMQQRFFQLASHELRTPITVARGYTELLREECVGGPSVAEDTAIVLDELSKLDRIAGRLLALVWAHDTSGSTVVDIKALAQRVARRWAPVSVRPIRAEVGPVTVCGDEERLETALDCLVDNAIVHTGSHTSIVLRAYPDDGWAVLEVEDDGPGLGGRGPPVPPHGPPANGVRGLGLAIVRGVVDAHHGVLRLDDGRGGGLRVTMRLPLVSGRCAAPANTVAPGTTAR
jgi:signal transduction histidine kinase